MSSVTRQARMLDSITADLLTAAEIQRGTLHLEPQEVDPLSVIDTVITDRYLVTVSAQVEDDRQVVADPMRLEQMLSNLVGNALKYGRAPYVVRVEPDPQDRTWLRIVVIDSGEGVPEDFRDQLFREFSRPSGAVATGHRPGALRRARASPRTQSGTVDYSSGPDRRRRLHAHAACCVTGAARGTSADPDRAATLARGARPRSTGSRRAAAGRGPGTTAPAAGPTRPAGAPRGSPRARRRAPRCAR